MTDQGHRRLRTALAADYIGYAESTLEKKRLDGSGPPFIRLGRAIAYDTRDLDAWLAARRATSTSDRTGPTRKRNGPSTLAGVTEAGTGDAEQIIRTTAGDATPAASKPGTR
jgi:predicted DNA-binding transcriptional regulator AlpA